MTAVPPAEPPLSVGPAGVVLRELWQLDHRREKASRAMEIAFGVSAQQRMMLRLIGKYPGITPSQLAGALCLDAGTVSTAVGRLGRKGLVERRPGRRDRRRVSLGLTEAGRDLDRGGQGAIELAVLALMAGSAAEDIAATLRVLKQLSKLLEVEAARALEGRGRPVEQGARRQPQEGRTP